MLVESCVVGMLLSKCIEEPGCFLAVLEQTQWFRFQPQVKVVATGLGSSGNVLDAHPDVIADLPFLFRGMNESFEGARQRADTALNTVRHEFGQQVKEPV